MGYSGNLAIWDKYIFFTNASTRGVLSEKVFLEALQNSQENTCTRVSALMKLQASNFNFITKEALAQIFSCEICEISQNTFFTAHLRATASVYTLIYVDKWFEFSLKIPVLESF